MSTFDIKYGINHFTKEQLSKYMNMSINTVKSRIQKLLEKKLLFAYHSPVIQNMNTFAGESNIYYLPGDFDKAEKYYKETRKKYFKTKGV